MLNKFAQHISENFDFIKDKKLLLATSGGLDSMVMVQLFHQLSYSIAIAHCNFQLRGVESFEDQNFVNDYAQANQIPVFITQFDTKAFAEDYKVSTQVAARDLRYSWFYELLESESYDYILTAHHADDTIETFLINLVRGTGLDGLTGIPAQNGSVIRPLMIFSRQEIESYALENGISWREDSSNASDKYLRNKIRHHLVPLLKELNTDFIPSFQKTQNHLQEAQTLVEDAAIMVYQQVAKEADDQVYFDLKQLKRLPNYASYLYQWLNEYGFTAWKDIYDLVQGQSGKQVFSKEYRLLKDRGFLILSQLEFEEEQTEFSIEKDQNKVNIPLNLSFCKVADISVVSNKTIFVDEDMLVFPLILRKWQEGDVLYPFGMNGQSKKLSKFFKDEKLSLIEKEKTWLLCSQNKIIWVVGLRQDDRFRINTTTNNILQITVE